jgi:hypothetical protein
MNACGVVTLIVQWLRIIGYLASNEIVAHFFFRLIQPSRLQRLYNEAVVTDELGTVCRKRATVFRY